MCSNTTLVRSLAARITIVPPGGAVSYGALPCGQDCDRFTRRCGFVLPLPVPRSRPRPVSVSVVQDSPLGVSCDLASRSCSRRAQEALSEVACVVTSAVSGWSEIHLEYPFPGPLGRFPSITGLKVFVAHWEACIGFARLRKCLSHMLRSGIQALVGLNPAGPLRAGTIQLDPRVLMEQTQNVMK